MSSIITNDMLQRVVNVKVGNDTATAIIIHKNNTTFLITAAHLFKGFVNASSIKIEIRHSNGRWQTESCTLYLSEREDADVAILRMNFSNQSAYADDSDILTSNNLILGQDIYFLGFPYNFSQEVGYAINEDFPLPLVKKAIVSSLPNPSINVNFFLDGNNNPGFSGGPVCFFDQKSKKFKIAGIISAFLSDKIEMSSVTGWKTCIPINTGIIVACDVYFAKEILDKII